MGLESSLHITLRTFIRAKDENSLPPTSFGPQLNFCNLESRFSADILKIPSKFPTLSKNIRNVHNILDHAAVFVLITDKLICSLHGYGVRKSYSDSEASTI